MKRPSITDFFPEATTPADLQMLFSTNPELYRFIQALDGYIDYLEDFYVKSESLKMIEEIAENGITPEIIDTFKKIETEYGAIYLKKLDRLTASQSHTIQTRFGDLNIKEDKSLKPNEIRITKIEKP